MPNNKLVSIITPCYNGEYCLPRLFESIIKQTYRPIEFILINDGSTDGTKEYAESYIHKFKEADIDFLIVNQENKGLGGAINTGLKYFTGEYLCWPDADDYLEPTSIEDRVEMLKQHPEYAVVSSDAYIRNSDHPDAYVKLLSDGMKYLESPNQFEHLLDGEAIFCCGCHMARTAMLLDVNPNRDIYPARRGQNWQLLLPLYYKYNWVFLDKPLYNYIVSPNSMSRDPDNLEAILYRYEEHETIINETLKQIEEVQHADLQVYYKRILSKYTKLRMAAAVKYNNKELFRKELSIKRRTTGIDTRDRIMVLRMYIPLFNRLFKSIASKKRTIVHKKRDENILKNVKS